MRLLLLFAILTAVPAPVLAYPAGTPGASVPFLKQLGTAPTTSAQSASPTASNTPLNVAQPVAKVATRPGIHPAVVRVVAPGNGTVSYGSGTLVDVNGEYGLIVTNYHVINEATQPISVVFPDGFYSLATVRKVDRDWDLAALVIKRPNVQPVPLAAAAPRPGETLTIAGYGSGQFRAAAGACTQYVAPGTRMPFEMVELAAKARHGDSGGPILNSRGEMAGVLFGEGGGRTAGSYCGRVKWFLASLTERPGQPASPVQAPPLQVAASDSTPPLTEVPRKDPFARRPAAEKPIVEQPAIERLAERPIPERPRFDPPSESITSTRIYTPAPSSDPVNPTASLASSSEQVTWSDFAGATLADQTKTFLAILGCCAVLLHSLRIIGGD